MQTLDGNQAEQFIRFRSGYVEGDIGRVDAQKIFIGACINKLKSSFNVTTISNIAKEVLQYVSTDIPFADLVYYAKQALSVDLGNMTMMTLPGIQGRQYNTSGTWYYFAYREGTIAAVNKYFNSYNIDITAEMFDRDGALYDNDGSYMHSVFLTPHKSEEAYTADGTDDIYIYQYNNSSKPATKATSSATTETHDPEETTDPLVTGETTDESGVHIGTADPFDTIVSEETVESDYSEETSEVSAEIEETTFEVLISEETAEPEETFTTEKTFNVEETEQIYTEGEE